MADGPSASVLWNILRSRLREEHILSSWNNLTNASDPINNETKANVDLTVIGHNDSQMTQVMIDDLPINSTDLVDDSRLTRLHEIQVIKAAVLSAVVLILLLSTCRMLFRLFVQFINSKNKDQE